jgi:hypothetical protein
MKHTPGPWEIVENAWSTTTIRSGDTTVAVLSCEEEATEDNQFELEAIQKANAKLIAAAPKMYDYIKLLASSGDLQAIHILESIDAGR